ncbi:MAG: hypothetical protein BWX89_01009 [candidate division TA06 bacterium ADurb.Bin131]|uniref:SGNH hydrolase-type esterase domain-containing protein n=1 Tax=candidate division TA06 bacterium ADurb.Bin131 TaxID=1852827 RepID=A0A1V6C908_UNCT6|nr:MAG: hypothetical protein BWX89_01009 [candidate division TA06 bacterium ADurb.Bin131]
MEKEILWLRPDEKPFEINGFAWFDKEKIYRRLPENPQYKIPEAVDYLADNTSGGVIRFRTDSDVLMIKVKIKEVSGMPHMPASGQSGFDCYIGKSTKEVYCSTAIPDINSKEYERKFFQFEKKEFRDISLYFPLYMGVEDVLVGIEKNSKVAKPSQFKEKGRIVAYGTSITQGGCASRPAMGYTNILSRWLGIEFINLGFSGSGKGEPELAHLITMISKVRCIILDYQANTDYQRYITTLPEFVKILRNRFKDIPIIIISRTPVSIWAFDKKAKTQWEKGYKFQDKFVKEMNKQGDRLIFSYNGSVLFKEIWQESTVDGGHPTDLGFLTMAKALYPILKRKLRV